MAINATVLPSSLKIPISVAIIVDLPDQGRPVMPIMCELPVWE